VVRTTHGSFKLRIAGPFTPVGGFITDVTPFLMISHLDIKRSAAEILRSEKIVRCLRHCQNIALQSCDRKARGAGTSSFFVSALMRSLCAYICMYTPLVLHSTQKQNSKDSFGIPELRLTASSRGVGKGQPFHVPTHLSGILYAKQTQGVLSVRIWPLKLLNSLALNNRRTCVKELGRKSDAAP
jgi:hypothetical protein